jgi:hypothetical protein
MRSAVLAALVLAGLGALGIVRLKQGPLTLDILAEQVSQALERQFDGFDVDVDHAHLEWTDGKPILAVTGVTIRDSAGNLVVAAPQADIAFDPASLAIFRLVPRHISFVGLAMAVTIDPDGNVSISATGTPDSELEDRDAKAQPVQTRDVSFGPGALLDALSQPQGPMRVLEQAGVRDGRLRVNDRRRGRSVLYDGLALTYDRPTPAEGRLSLRAKGPSGEWSLGATISGQPGTERVVKLQTTDLAISDLIGIAEPGAVPVITEMPVSGAMALTVGANNSVTDLKGWITGGSAMVLFSDPDAEPVFVDSIKGEFGWDAAGHAATIDKFELLAGDTAIRLTGRVSPPSAQSDRWKVSLATDGSALAGESPQDKPVAITRGTIEAHMPIGLSALVVDKLDLQGQKLSVKGSFAMGRSDEIDGFRMDIEATKLPARAALSLWPSMIVSEVRSYLIEAIEGGTVDRINLRYRLSWADLLAGMQKKPVPDDAFEITATGSGGSMRPLPGLPVLTDLDADIRVTGRTTAVTFKSGTVPGSGGARALSLSNGRFEVKDTSLHPPNGLVSFDIAGDVATALQVLRSETLRPFAPIRTDPGPVKGQIEARIAIASPLAPDVSPQDIAVQASGTATGVAVDGLFGKEKLEGGAFSFAQDRNGLLLKGDARLSGSPAAIELHQPTGGPADLTVALTLDEAARARRGIKLAPQLTGPVDVKLTFKDPGAPKVQPRVEADLTKATLTDALPGWSKPAGKPAKLAFRLDMMEDGTAGLDDLLLDGGGGVSARGQVKVAPDGTLASVKLASLKIAPGDDMRVDMERHGGVPRVTVRGSAIDARPFLRSLMSPGAPSGGKGLGDVDLDIKSNGMTGLNNVNVSGLDGRFALRNGEFREFRLAGRFGPSPLSGQLARTEAGTIGIVVESGNAGDFLRFFDIYRKMDGGAMLLQLDGAGAVMSGSLIVNRFVLVNEPALARTAPPSEPGQPTSVTFTKLKAGFSVGNGRLAIRDATMWGNAVGGTLEGQMDFNRDRIDMSGTFVPAYGLNNMFNKVPIVGTILGGGQNEGLFAVNFRITGKASQPTVSINPLSAVAPGILRKFFGVFGPGEQVPGPGDPAITSSAPPPDPMRLPESRIQGGQ